MTAYDPALLDLSKLTAWLSAQGLLPTDSSGAAKATLTASSLTGGRSNVMFSIRVKPNPDPANPDIKNWVLRRPATVAVARANDGMRREFRILSALEPTNVPHPRPIALCEDLEVLGCVFYLMEQVDGIVPHEPLPEVFTANANYRQELAEALVAALATLHQVAWQTAGLADFGQPEGFHERQVSRWKSQLESYQGRDLPDLATAGSWLKANLPSNWTAGIMHGDYHMFNVLIHPEPPAQVVAIVDWETATIGDPLLDFVGFCEAWRSMRAGGGWPSYAAMLELYLDLRQLERRPTTTEQQYYGVLYNFRMAVLLEGIYQRSLRDPNRANQDAIGDRALFNAARCQAIISDPSCLFN